MIDYINVQLSVWGKAMVHRGSAGLGYPSVSPMFRDASHGGAYGSREPLGVSDSVYIDETDRAVQRLCPDDQRLCVEFYQVGGTAVDIARRLGIARQRLYERVHAVHCLVLGFLNDIAAGI